jgi:hypothetical protein
VHWWWTPELAANCGFAHPRRSTFRLQLRQSGRAAQAAEFGDVEVTHRGLDHADDLKAQEVLESFISQKVDGTPSPF